jgi:maltooligosyltrehalose trehalohydrolase
LAPLAFRFAGAHPKRVSTAFEQTPDSDEARAPGAPAGSTTEPLLGPLVQPDQGGVRFGVFAGAAGSCTIQLVSPGGGAPTTFPMTPVGGGYFHAEIPGVGHGTRYRLLADGQVLPDTFARYFPDGVHGPAMVVESKHVWRHGAGVSRPLAEQVIYELHVGTFSESGDYRGVRERLPELAALGITTLELMPIAAFPGARGWGYDGVAPFAPYAPYGTPDELRALVDEAHGLGLSVILDVVYNHLGPSGNYLPAWCPACFTREIRNAWGDALNYGHPLVRRLVLESARYWLTSFRFDGLRLDATHAIIDPSDRHIVNELAAEVARLAPRKVLIAEDDRNDSGVITAWGLDGVWADDFHHQVSVTMTGEADGYYAGYRPSAADIARTIARGWLYEGQVSPYAGHPRGQRADDLEAHSFIYCLENHDQVGNRAFGERLAARVSTAQYRAASTLLLFLPMTPLLFMGQEWAASSPFLFFTDHEPALGHLISAGRREEFRSFRAFADPQLRAAIPDPQAESTFIASKLVWREREGGEHAAVLGLYRKLLALRRTDPVMRWSSRRELAARAAGEVVIVERWHAGALRCLVLNLSAKPVRYADLSLPFAVGADGVELMLASDGNTEPGDAVPPHTAVILGASTVPVDRPRWQR